MRAPTRKRDVHQLAILRRKYSNLREHDASAASQRRLAQRDGARAAAPHMRPTHALATCAAAPLCAPTASRARLNPRARRQSSRMQVKSIFFTRSSRAPKHASGSHEGQRGMGDSCCWSREHEVTNAGYGDPRQRRNTRFFALYITYVDRNARCDAPIHSYTSATLRKSREISRKFHIRYPLV